MPFVLTRGAEDDLQRIDSYLFLSNHEAAERVGRALEEAMDLLSERPLIGHERPDLTTRPFRFWPVHSYLIVYDPRTSPLQIIRVVHGATDVASRLTE